MENKTYSNEESVLRAIRQRNDLNMPLGSGSLNTGIHANIPLYRAGLHLYGTWKKAIEAAGLSYEKTFEYSRKYPTRNAVLTDIRNGLQTECASTQNPKHPAPVHNPALLTAANRFFGNWKSAVKAAGNNKTNIRKPRAQKYPEKSHVLEALRKRVESGLPIRYKSVHMGTHADSKLIHSAKKHFGSWGEALEAVGINYKEILNTSKPRKYPDAESVILEIQRRATAGMPNNYQALNKEAPYRDKALLHAGYHCFGSWPDAIEAAGFEARRSASWTKKFKTNQSVVTEIQRRIEVGLPINYQAIAKEKTHCDRSLLRSAREFHGSWKLAVEAAGIDYEAQAHRKRLKYPDAESVKTKIQQRTKNDIPLSRIAVDRGEHRDKGLIYSAARFLGSWQSAVAAAGFDYPAPKNSPRGRKYPDAESVVREIRRRKKNKLPLNSFAVQKGEFRDKALLNSASKTLGSWGNAVVVAGFGYSAGSPIKATRKYANGAAVIKELLRRKDAGQPIGSKAVGIEDRALQYGGRNFFGSWAAALKAAGITPNGVPYGIL